MPPQAHKKRTKRKQSTVQSNATTRPDPTTNKVESKIPVPPIRKSKLKAKLAALPIPPSIIPYETLSAHLNPARYNIHALHIVSASKINAKVTRVLDVLQHETAASSGTGTKGVEGKPTDKKQEQEQRSAQPREVVALSAKAHVASKAISIAEIVKRCFGATVTSMAASDGDRQGTGADGTAQSDAERAEVETKKDARRPQLFQYSLMRSIPAAPVAVLAPAPAHASLAGTLTGADAPKHMSTGNSDINRESTNSSRKRKRKRDDDDDDDDDDGNALAESAVSQANMSKTRTRPQVRVSPAPQAATNESGDLTFTTTSGSSRDEGAKAGAVDESSRDGADTDADAIAAEEEDKEEGKEPGTKTSTEEKDGNEEREEAQGAENEQNLEQDSEDAAFETSNRPANPRKRQKQDESAVHQREHEYEHADADADADAAPTASSSADAKNQGKRKHAIPVLTIILCRTRIESLRRAYGEQVIP